MRDQTIGIVGFGNQGRSWALNLRDSGWNVHLFLRPDSSSRKKAQDLGFHLLNPQSLREMPVLAMLLPDDAMPIFFKDYGTYLTENQAIVFAHGFCLHYQTAPWPANIDLILLAPKGIGKAVRSEFESGHGVPCVFAAHQDYTGNANAIAMALAKGIGGTRGGIYESTAQQEVEADLFSEQVLLCGGIPKLIFKTFEILVESGIQPEVAYLECVHELGYMVELFKQKGFYETLKAASKTAQYGGFRAAKSLVDHAMENKLNELFSDIRKGSFSKDLSKESLDHFSWTKTQLEALKSAQVESTGHHIRKNTSQKGTS